jgi:hypothetical protein
MEMGVHKFGGHRCIVVEFELMPFLTHVKSAFQHLSRDVSCLYTEEPALVHSVQQVATGVIDGVIDPPAGAIRIAACLTSISWGPGFHNQAVLDFFSIILLTLSVVAVAVAVQPCCP